MSQHKDRKLQFSNHPQWTSVLKIVKTLQENGFETLIAGGAVRDALLGKVGLDLDLASKAEPDQVEALFPNTVAVGKAFGVIRVIEMGHSIEVATYRLDQNYKDGRHPENVVFTSRQEDAKRRDFTVNALFYDILTDTLFDDVGGVQDLDKRLLRAVGEPAKRFQEDELRRLRLLRFVSQLGFDIEPKTWQAVQSGAEGLKGVSRERITEETYKTWKGEYLKTAFPKWLECGVAVYVDSFWAGKKPQDFPEIVWQWPRKKMEEIWAHYFSFMWQKNHDWIADFAKYRLSRDLQAKLLSGYKAFKLGENVFKMSWGEQRLLIAEPLAEWSLQAALELQGKSLHLWQNLKEKAHNAGELPEPLLNGLDLKDQFQGPKLGEALKKAYLEQLNQNWHDKKDALSWIRSQVF